MSDEQERKSLKRRGVLAVIAIFLSGVVVGGLGLALFAKFTIEKYLRQPNILAVLLEHVTRTEFELPEEGSEERVRQLMLLLDEIKLSDMVRRDYVSNLFLRSIAKSRQIVPPHQAARFELGSTLFVRHSHYYLVVALYRELNLDMDAMAKLDVVIAKHAREILFRFPPDTVFEEAHARQVLVAALPEIRSSLPPEGRQKLDSLGPELEGLQASLEDRPYLERN